MSKLWGGIEMKCELDDLYTCDKCKKNVCCVVIHNSQTLCEKCEKKYPCKCDSPVHRRNRK